MYTIGFFLYPYDIHSRVGMRFVLSQTLGEITLYTILYTAPAVSQARIIMICEISISAVRLRAVDRSTGN